MSRAIVILILAGLLIGCTSSLRQQTTDPSSGSGAATVYVALDRGSPGRYFQWRERMRLTDVIKDAGWEEVMSHTRERGRVLHPDGSSVFFRYSRIVDGSGENLVLKPGDRVYFTSRRFF